MQKLTPGLDLLDIVAKVRRGGARAGVVAALGSTAGGFVHIAAAAIGVSALIAASSAAFAVLKWLGAACLVCVGVSMLWSASKQNAIKIEAYYAYYTRAIGLNDSNNCSKNDLNDLKSVFVRGPRLGRSQDSACRAIEAGMFNQLAALPSSSRTRF